MQIVAACMLGFGAAMSAGELSGQAGAAPSGRPNIVMIMIDTLRADHLGCYGYARPTSPAIDSLASDGVLFERAYTTAPWTLPAVCSVMTAVLPSVHGVTRSDRRCPKRFGTFVENLRDAGYYCSAVVSNPYLDHHFGFARGFDAKDYDDVSVLLQAEGDVFGGPGGKNIRTVRSSPFTHWVAVRQLERKCVKRLPFFLFLHYFDPHDLYIPPQAALQLFQKEDYGGTFTGEVATLYQNPPKASPEDVQHLTDLYDAEIRFTDDYIGRLIERLKKHNLYDGALIVLFSDHGEELYDHSGFHHGHTVYEELIHVPLIVKLPKGPRAGTRVPNRVSTLSLGPTLLEYCGAEAMKDVQRVSFASLLAPDGGSRFPEIPIVAETDDWTTFGAPLRTVIVGDRKAIWSAEQDKLLAAFDLRQDPRERHNQVSPDPPAWAAELASDGRDFLQSTGGAASAESLVADPELLRRLKELPYAQ